MEVPMKVIKIREVPGEAAGSGLFTGPVTRQAIITGQQSKQFIINQVNFDKGVRNKFHIHTSDQVLIVTSGKGICATEQEKVTVFPGDVSYSLPGKSIGMVQLRIPPFPISMLPARTARRLRLRNSLGKERVRV